MHFFSWFGLVARKNIEFVKPVTCLPHIIILFCAIGAVFLFPGAMKDDALSYINLAKSISHGSFELIPGEPTMYREPGYPLFLSLFIGLGMESLILAAQVFLAVGACEIWRKIFLKIDRNLAWIGSWGTVLAYGYWLSSRFYGYEILTGFLLATFLLCVMELGDRIKTRKNTILFSLFTGFVFGCLAITKGTYVLLLIPIYFWVFWDTKKVPWNKIKLTTFAVLCTASIFLPWFWMMRNFKTFGIFSIASRPGVVLFVRSVEAELPARALRDSFLSQVLGEKLSKSVVGDWRFGSQEVQRIWKAQYQTFFKDNNIDQVDVLALKSSKDKIFGSSSAFVKYLIWTPIEILSLLSLPSPLYADSSFEPMFGDLQGRLPYTLFVFLLLVYSVQVVWWIGGALGCWLGWRKYGSKFVVAIPYLYLVAVHAPLDNVVRFSAPIQPIIGAFVLLSLSVALGWVAKALHKRKAVLTSPTEV